MGRSVGIPLYRAAVLAVGLSTSFCAGPLGLRPPGYVAVDTMMPTVGSVTFQNQAGYQSYHAGTLRDATGQRFVRNVRGEACQRGVGVPYATISNFFTKQKIDGGFTADVRWGDGSLNKAMAQAMMGAQPDETLADVTVDLRQLSVLGIIYRQTCLVVRGKIMAPVVRGLLEEPLLPAPVAPEVAPVGDPAASPSHSL